LLQRAVAGLDSPSGVLAKPGLPNIIRRRFEFDSAEMRREETEMSQDRREFLQFTGLVGALAAAGLLSAEQARAQQAAWNKAAFETKNLADTVKALGGGAVAESKDITITGPDIAENGAVVPVGVTSKVPGTQAVYILVEKNPNMLAAGFNIPAGTEANVSTRIKMGESSNVIGLVKANNRFYMASKEVKVTIGGCGG
jgi:sulfur-oxidizing protein SoxY